MKPRKTTYIAHRWIGLIISLQLLAWSVGGLIFSVLDIDEVRGTNDARNQSFIALDQETLEALPPGIGQAIRALGAQEPASINLVDRGLGAFWEVRSSESELIARLYPSGEASGLITPEQAKFIALNDFKPEAAVRSVELIEDNPPGEYRGPLPAYRVDLEHPKNPHIYVDAMTGQINARRNDAWRTFDFFWMLHIMDYKDRSNFNHPVLIIASVFAVAASGTGIALWGWRLIPRFFSKRKRTKTAQNTTAP